MNQACCTVLRSVRYSISILLVKVMLFNITLQYSVRSYNVGIPTHGMIFYLPSLNEVKITEAQASSCQIFRNLRLPQGLQFAVEH